MVAPFIDPALGVLRALLRLVFPGIIIYWIGDAKHRQRLSDHNPEADGSVDAIDIMVTSDFSQRQAQALVDALSFYKDWRISYIIWRGKIWHAATGWQIYHGADQHMDHIHISRNDIREGNTDPWKIALIVKVQKMLTMNVKLPVLSQGANDDDSDGYNHVARIQRAALMPASQVDGAWGPKTTAAIAKFCDIPVNAAKRSTEDIYRKLYGLSR